MPAKDAMSDAQFAEKGSLAGATRSVHTMRELPAGSTGYVVSLRHPVDHEKKYTPPMTAAQAVEHRMGMLADPAVRADPHAQQGAWLQDGLVYADRSTFLRYRTDVPKEHPQSQHSVRIQTGAMSLVHNQAAAYHPPDNSYLQSNQFMHQAAPAVTEPQDPRPAWYAASNEPRLFH